MASKEISPLRFTPDDPAIGSNYIKYFTLGLKSDRNMKQQVLVIGGGTTFNNQEEYISYLKKEIFDSDKLKPRKDWKDTLVVELGASFEVLRLQMPNKTNVRYKEWKIRFERVVPLLEKNVIFVGHSLGGMFLVKYFSENSFKNPIKAVILVSAPFDGEGLNETLSQFKIPSSLSKFSQAADKIFLMHSKDDPVVPYNHINKYQKALSKAELITLRDKGHVNQESFPEIVKVIKKL